jgi:hypothetical protein
MRQVEQPAIRRVPTHDDGSANFESAANQSTRLILGMDDHAVV